MNKLICFDMDGTVADLYGVPHWLDKLMAEDESPYREAKPLIDMEALSQILEALIYKGWEVCVISWASKGASKAYKKKIRAAKLEWLARYKFPGKAHIIQYGATKANAIRKYTDNAILFDDDAKVRKGWKLGRAIDPTKVDILEELEKLI